MGAHDDNGLAAATADPIECAAAVGALSPGGVLDALSDGFAILDADWRFVYLNAAGVALLEPLAPGVESFIGRNHWELFPDLHDFVVGLMRAGHASRWRLGAAADQPGVADGVMGRAERPRGYKRFFAIK